MEFNIYNAFVCLPLIIIAGYCTDQFRMIYIFFYSFEMTKLFCFNLIMSSILGVFITIGIQLVVFYCGPLATISLIFKDFFLTIAGFLLFNDAKVTTMAIIGCKVSFSGAMYFAYRKYKEDQSNKKIQKKISYSTPT